MPRVRPLTPDQAKRTLAHRFAPRADRLRQLATRFGIRPYRVFLCWTKFSGHERGEGDESIYARAELLPTPRVTDFSAMARNPWSVGQLPDGTIRVDRVSALFTADMLRGVLIPDGRRPLLVSRSSTGQLVAGTQAKPETDDQVDFFYEVVEDGRGDEQPERQRFRLYGKPFRDAGNVNWSIMLQPASDPMGRDGEPLTSEEDVHFDADDT